MRIFSLRTTVILLIAVLLLSSCGINLSIPKVIRGSGNVGTEVRDVKDFDRVELNGAGKLIITQGTGEKLLIEAEDNILTKIVSKVENGVLTLGFDSSFQIENVLPTKEIVYTLNVINLTGLTINGAATLELRDLVMQDFNLKVNGAGDYNLSDIQASNLTITIDGGADLMISGNASQQAITINGAGKYEAGELQTKNCSITINGASDATVWVSDDLTININGAGGVKYYGDPHVTQNIAGVGNVKSLGTK